MSNRIKLGAITLTAVLAACGSAAATQTTSAAQPASTAAPAVTTAAPTATTSSESTADKVSANTASQSELVAALTSAGVDNADRWAREIEEYRPYDSSDSDLAKLRQNLAKYNPGEGVVDAIVSVLQP